MYSACLLAQSLQHSTVKAVELNAYECLSEAYRQHFRNNKKIMSQTFVEFAGEKATLFDKWCSASKVTDLASLCELVLLEEFKN